ncbi:MAG: hypothetical protein R6U40_03045 [Desulfobacterales bacterium]
MPAIPSVDLLWGQADRLGPGNYESSQKSSKRWGLIIAESITFLLHSDRCSAAATHRQVSRSFFCDIIIQAIKSKTSDKTW